MTLLVDQNEERNQPDLLAYLRQSVDVRTGAYNQHSGNPVAYPDFTIIGGDKLVGVNRKQVSEVLSSLDKVEEQLQRELSGPCEYLVLLIEGIMYPGNDGVWAYQLDWLRGIRIWNSEQVGSVGFKRQHFRTNYKGIQNWQTRLEWLGINVVHTYSLYDTACKLVALHDLVMKGEESKTLNRLIKSSFTIAALDPTEKAMALSLMGIQNGGIGEEAALTIARSFSSITELIRYWDQGSTIADTMMRSGTRRLGNALESKLQKALGWQGRHSTANPELSRQGYTQGLLSNP